MKSLGKDARSRAGDGRTATRKSHVRQAAKEEVPSHQTGSEQCQQAQKRFAIEKGETPDGVVSPPGQM